MPRTASKVVPFVIVAVTAAILLAGCGGGGESSSTDIAPVGTGTPTAKVLSWTPPQNFVDQTPLDPSKDLSHYEIHINTTGNFTAADLTEATVSAFDPATGKLVTSFDLANLSPYLAPSVTYYVSMQSVSNTGVKSDFSPAASFSL